MNWVDTLLKPLGYFAIVTIASVFVLRKAFDLLFSKELERFKFQFRVLHTQRATVIRKVYRLIVETEDAFVSLIKPFQAAGEPPIEEKAKAAVEKYNELSSYYRTRRLYFDEHTAQHVDKMLDVLQEIWLDRQYVQDARAMGEKYIKKWGQAWDRTKDEIPKLKHEIECSFRKIIGVDSAEHKQ